MPRRVHLHRHINFRPETLAIPCMFIHSILILDAVPLSLPPTAPATSGQLVDVIMDSFPPTHYVLSASFSFFFRYLSLLSLVVARFLLPRTEHDRCAALTRSLKYSGEFAAPQFSAISQKPPFILSPHRDGAVNVRETS